MELIVRDFAQLTAAQLHRIYRLRVAVFVVEQQCPYQEVDDADSSACHVWLQDGEDIAAYLRILPGEDGQVSIGRVIAARRRQGLGSRILSEGIRLAREKYSAQVITLEAQVYAMGLYERAGFQAVSQEFLEDGIPHIRMRLTL